MGMFKASTPAKAAPAKKAAASKAAPAKKAASKFSTGSKSRRDDDDEDLGGVTSGWGGAEKMASEYSDFAARLSMEEETIVIRFLDDEPYANVATHWVRKGAGKNIKTRSYICLGKGKCPICALGDNPRVQYCFNVAKLTEDDPIVYSWEVGVRVYRQIQKKASDAKTAPLSRLFYELERQGMTKDNTVYTLKEVRRVRDLDEDWPNLHIPDDDELAALDRYTTETVAKQRTSLKELREVAAEMSGDELDDEDDD